MAKRTFLLCVLSLTIFLSCSRRTDDLAGLGNVNIRLAVTPAEISADSGTAVVSIHVDAAAGRPVKLGDIQIATSAGYDKIGAIMATGKNRFTAELKDLTDLSLSPVTVTVQVGDAKQELDIKIVPGSPAGLALTLAQKTVSADVGEVSLTVSVKDQNANLAPGSITLSTTAGVVSQLVTQADGSYTAVLSGLVHTDDSPVTVTARTGSQKSEAVVQILAGALDHFTVSEIASPTVVGEYRPFQVTARDQHENLVSAFESFVNVSSTRGAGDIEVEIPGTSSGEFAFFTPRNFVLGTSYVEQFRARTPADAPGIRLAVVDTAGHQGQSNLFVVDHAPANQVLIRTQTGFNGIVGADGCVKPTVAGDACLVGAVKNPDQTWAYSPLSTRLEIRLRRYQNSPDEPDGQAVLLGGRGSEMVVTMTDAEGTVYNSNSPHTGPYLGAIEDDVTGYYYVSLYNLRDQAKSPYTVTVRFVNLVDQMEVSVVSGTLHHFAFTEIPSQKAQGATVNPTFLTNVIARDRWGNQVFAFQDSVDVFHRVAGNETFLTKSPPAYLGTTFSFAVSLPTSGTNSKLIAKHGGLAIEGESNPFTVFGTEHFLTTNLLVLLPGQYSAGVPALGALEATLPSPTGLAANEPFEILMLARTAAGGAVQNLPFGLDAFDGRVLLTGIGSGLEIVDNSCAQGTSSAATTSSLTPSFLQLGIGTGTILTGTNESACYLTVRMTTPAAAANISVNPAFTSSFQINPLGAQSSVFEVLQGEMESLRISTIPTPQLASVIEPAAGRKTSFVIQALDLAGNQTNNTIGCTALSIADVKGYLRYTGPVAFDENGVARVEGVWYQASLSAFDRQTNQIEASCSLQLKTASNVFELVSEGVGCLQVFPPATVVRAHQEFRFAARAYQDTACTIPAVNVNYGFTMTDTTGTMFPGRTTAFTNGELTGQVAYIDRVSDAAQICLRGAGRLACSEPFSVEVGQLNYFAFDMAGFPNSVTVGSTYVLKAEAIDAGHNVVPDYIGRIYLSNSYGTADFVLPSGTLSKTAKVMSVFKIMGGQDTYHLYFCTDQTGSNDVCTPSLTQLRVRLSDMSSGDYFAISDGKGHTGISLPHLYSVGFPPLSGFGFGGGACGPIVDSIDIYQETYFNVCLRALSVGADNQTYFKRDYHAANVALDSADANALLAPSAVTFVAGLAQQQVAFSSLAPASTNFFVAPFSTDFLDVATFTLPTTYSIASTAPPALVKSSQKFFLDLTVTPGTQYNGSLRVTDSSGSIVPVCGSAETAGTCGFVDANGRSVTGNFVAGSRRQYFNIPTEYYGTVICLADGFGVEKCLAPIDVESNLHRFLVKPVENLLARGSSYSLSVTAVDIDGNAITNFNAPLLLSYSGGAVSPSVLPAAFVDGELNTSFTITNTGPSSGHLTVTFSNSSKIGQSNHFTVQERALSKFAWNPITGDKPGYVDFDVTVKALDQFNAQTNFTGKVNFSATNGYAVRPTQSTNFTAGVWSGKLALDGTPLTTVITATQQGGSVNGMSNLVTVTTSSVASFSVVLNTASFVKGCTYPITIKAMNGADGSGSVITGFSGKVALRWFASNFGVPNYSGNLNPDTTNFAPAITPNFTNGVATLNVKLIDQPSGFGWPAAASVNAYVEGAAIQGNSAAFDLAATGTCPP